MLIIPAIDIKDGKCVRLRQGRMDDDTVFDDNPVDVAKRWLDQGARRIHLVDLDGAFAGEPRNAEVVRKICEISEDVPVQIGGGIRSQEIAQAYIDVGIRYLIIGTLAVKSPDFVDGVSAIVYTDISRDGMMQGVNTEATAALGDAVSIPIIASGGVSKIDDIHSLGEQMHRGIAGVIVGRALYENGLDLSEAQQLADSFAQSSKE